MLHNGPPHTSNEGYAYAKRMLELQCRHYNKAYNREYICVVPVNLYGPYDNFSLTNGHFIPMIMNRLHKTIEWRDHHPTGDIVAYGTGNPLRQFLYAPDFAEIICNILIGEQYKQTGPIICCNDDEYTIKDIVEKIAKLLDIMLGHTDDDHTVTKFKRRELKALVQFMYREQQECSGQ